METISNNFILSTSEKEIGEDVNGSTIYSKTYTGTGAPTSGAVIDSSLNASNVGWFVAEGSFYSDGELQQMSAMSGSYTFTPRMVSGGLVFIFAGYTNVGRWHMTIKYTKIS